MKKPTLAINHKIGLAMIAAGIVVSALSLLCHGTAQSLLAVIGIGLIVGGFYLASPIGF